MFEKVEEIVDYYFDNPNSIVKCEGCSEDSISINTRDFINSLYFCCECFEIYCKDCVEFSVLNSIGCINCKK